MQTQAQAQAQAQTRGMWDRIYQQMAGRPPPRAAPPPNPAAAPPPRRPPPDPTVEARVILGFEPGEPLTADKIKDRKRSLAKVFHPDRGSGGSVKQMQRVLAAADLLMARL
jgi:hypothetical protein